MVSICYKIPELLCRKTSVWRLGKCYSFIALNGNKLSIEKRYQFDELTEKDFVSTFAVWCDPAVHQDHQCSQGSRWRLSICRTSCINELYSSANNRKMVKKKQNFRYLAPLCIPGCLLYHTFYHFKFAEDRSFYRKFVWDFRRIF